MEVSLRSTIGFLKKPRKQFIGRIRISGLFLEQVVSCKTKADYKDLSLGMTLTISQGGNYTRDHVTMFARWIRETKIDLIGLI